MITKSIRPTLAALFAISALLLGCAREQHLYDGPQLSPDNAVIKGSIGVLPGSTSLSVMSIDGKPLKPYAEQIEVLPGPHTLGIHYRQQLAGGLVATGEVAVEAQPGKTYQLLGKRNGNIVTLSIAEARESK
jgi:hypothetical protein